MTFYMTFYMTFGFGHKLKNGEPANNCYTTIEAENEHEAREKMFEIYGAKWSFMYNSAEDAGVDRFNLTHIPFGE